MRWKRAWPRLRAAAEMRALFAALILINCTAANAAQSETGAARFTGNGSLNAPIAQSTDQRFEISARLQANRQPGNDRFALAARLMPNAKAAGATCGPLGDEIFSDGFEATW
jgi:hypothetical protein